MAEKFDPYYTWLGIPPEDQPADHYRLLGVRQFESNPDVISNLTDQRMAHVKTFQAGPHGAVSQKLLNEIAAARVCLLNPEKRKAYDAKLREQIALETAPEALPLAEPEVVAPPPIAPPTSTPQSDSVSDAFAFIAATATRPVTAAGDLAVKKAIQSRAKQRARARWLFIAAPILGIAAVVAAIMIRNSQDADDGNPAAAPRVASTAPAQGGQKPSSAHGLSPSGKPSIVKSPENAGRGEGPNDSTAPVRQEATTPTKPNDPTAVVGNTEPSSNSPHNLPADNGSAKPAPVSAASSEEQFPVGQSVDVLRLVDANSKMVVAGNWSRNGQEIAVAPGQYSRIMIPVMINGSYDLEVEFTRASGSDAVYTMLPIGPHPCEIILSGWGGRASGLELVNGHDAIQTEDPIAVRPGNLQNGRRYGLLASVRIDSDDHASIDVSLDGKLYLPRWSGDPAAFSAGPRSSLPNPSELGLGAWQSQVVFHSARLKMISGSASLDPALMSADRLPATASAGAGSDPTSSKQLAFHQPDFQQWVSGVAALHPEEQVAAVVKELHELNPGFGGQETHRIENGVVAELEICTDGVTDISPVRATAGLARLICRDGKLHKSAVVDFSPLEGMQLSKLDAGGTRVHDLSPLRGQPLTYLDVSGTDVSDLSPLEGMKLEWFSCYAAPVADLSALHGMSLRFLQCGNTRVADLSPLRGMPLSTLYCDSSHVADLSPLAGMKLDSLTCIRTKVTDLSALKGMHLSCLSCQDTGVSDLTPLEGMSLFGVGIPAAKITKGMDVLRRMKTLKTIGDGEPRSTNRRADIFWKMYDAGKFK